MSTLEEVHATQDEIRDFLDKKKDLISKATPFEVLMNVAPATTTSIYAYLAGKTGPTIHQPRTWNVECVVPAVESGPRKFWQKKTDVAESHVVVFRGKYISRPPCSRPAAFPGPPPPSGFPGRAGWRGGPPIIMPTRRARSVTSSVSSRRGRKAVAMFELSQQEAENVINDYVASFSPLYDEIPVELRGAALKAIVLGDEDESDDLITIVTALGAQDRWSMIRKPQA